MLKITDITKQIKTTTRYNIFVDGQYRFSLHKEVVINNRLNIGLEISEEDLQKVYQLSQNKLAFDAALKYVSRKVCSGKQVADFLQKKDFNDKSITKAVDALKEYRYIDDTEYAKSYISSFKNSKGNKRLSYELIQKGIDKEIASNILEETDEYEACLKSTQKYMRNKELKDTTKVKQSLYRYLAYRGFSFDSINKAIKEFFDSDIDIE